MCKKCNGNGSINGPAGVDACPDCTKRANFSEPFKKGPWTDEEDELLIKLYKDGTNEVERVRRLNRGASSINKRKQKLFGTGSLDKAWPKFKDEKLIKMSGLVKDISIYVLDQIASNLDKTIPEVKERMAYLSRSKNRRKGSQLKYSKPLDDDLPIPNVEKVRKCTMCQKPFLSWGAGNRRCNPCSGLAVVKSGGDFDTPANNLDY